MLSWNSHSPLINPFATVFRHCCSLAFISGKIYLLLRSLIKIDSKSFLSNLNASFTEQTATERFWMNLNRCEWNIYTMLTSTWLLLSNNFVRGSDTVWQNKPELVFFSVQKYKSILLQSAPKNRGKAMTTTVEMYRCISGNSCKKSSLHCFEFSKLPCTLYCWLSRISHLSGNLEPPKESGF